MYFGFDVVELFGDGISVLDNRMTPILVEHGSPDSSVTFGQSSPPRRGRHDSVRRDRMYDVIDKMGQASAKAQGLHASITSGYRLAHSDHHLYIMVDRKTDSEYGSAVGILKVGHKTLFVYDSQNRQREMFPLCVLDFYVHESRQRTGCGRRLFDAMINRERVRPEHLAIDRPSHKFSSFLNKHYQLHHVIPQVNNFVVFQGFFNDRTDEYPRRAGTCISRPPACPRPRPFSHHGRSDFSELHVDARNREGRSQSNKTTRERLHSDPVKPEIQTSVTRACADSEVSGRSVPRITTPDLDVGGAPSRPRDGPSRDYLHFLSQLNYQDRRGHLVLSPQTKQNDNPASNHASDTSQPISIPRTGSRQSPIAIGQSRSLPNNSFFSNDQSERWPATDQSDRTKIDKSARWPGTDQSDRTKTDLQLNVRRTDQSERWKSANQSDRRRSDQSEGSKPGDQSWTVFGTPPSYYGRKWQHTKLW